MQYIGRITHGLSLPTCDRFSGLTEVQDIFRSYLFDFEPQLNSWWSNLELWFSIVPRYGLQSCSVYGATLVKVTTEVSIFSYVITATGRINAIKISSTPFHPVFITIAKNVLSYSKFISCANGWTLPIFQILNTLNEYATINFDYITWTLTPVFP